MKNEMNKYELDCFMDEVMGIVVDSDDRTSLIEDIMRLVEETAYDRGAYDETEIISELNNLMEDSDEYGFTELKNAIREICEENGWEEEEEEEEEEKEEPADCKMGTYGYIDDSTIDGKARVEIVKLLINNVPALMGNDNEVNEAITHHIAAILNSLAD